MRTAFQKSMHAYSISESVERYRDFVNSADSMGAGSRVDAAADRVVFVEVGSLERPVTLINQKISAGRRIIRVLDAQTGDVLMVRVFN
jgi:hypothetical protein